MYGTLAGSANSAVLSTDSNFFLFLFENVCITEF